VNIKERIASIVEKCRRGSTKDIEEVVSMLTNKVDLTTRKNIDFYLAQVTNPEGIARMERYLFHGSQIQRNYVTLFFARRDDWELIHRAYKLGLIDYRQAYSR
jgi:hypothetical protein